MSFICHIHNYTEYNEEWNVFSAFNLSKCTHTWSSGQPTMQRPGSSRGLPVGAGIRTHNLGLPRVSSPTLYPLGQRLPMLSYVVLIYSCTLLSLLSYVNECVHVWVIVSVFAMFVNIDMVVLSLLMTPWNWICRLSKFFRNTILVKQTHLFDIKHHPF